MVLLPPRLADAVGDLQSSASRWSAHIGQLVLISAPRARLNVLRSTWSARSSQLAVLSARSGRPDCIDQLAVVSLQRSRVGSRTIGSQRSAIGSQWSGQSASARRCQLAVQPSATALPVVEISCCLLIRARCVVGSDWSARTLAVFPGVIGSQWSARVDSARRRSPSVAEVLAFEICKLVHSGQLALVGLLCAFNLY